MISSNKPKRLIVFRWINFATNLVIAAFCGATTIYIFTIFNTKTDELSTDIRMLETIAVEFLVISCAFSLANLYGTVKLMYNIILLHSIYCMVVVGLLIFPAITDLMLLIPAGIGFVVGTLAYLFAREVHKYHQKGQSMQTLRLSAQLESNHLSRKVSNIADNNNNTGNNSDDKTIEII